MKKKKYCDDCQHLEFVTESSGEIISLCDVSKRRCVDERSGLFRDSCGPLAKNFVDEYDQ